MANATDLRIVKTLEAIHESFEELAGKQALESITVAELCRQARIGKKTFYRHYPALENLAQEYLDVFIGSFLDKTDGLNLPENNERLSLNSPSIFAMRGIKIPFTSAWYAVPARISSAVRSLPG